MGEVKSGQRRRIPVLWASIGAMALICRFPGLFLRIGLPWVLLSVLWQTFMVYLVGGEGQWIGPSNADETGELLTTRDLVATAGYAVSLFLLVPAMIKWTRLSMLGPSGIALANGRGWRWVRLYALRLVVLSVIALVSALVIDIVMFATGLGSLADLRIAPMLLEFIVVAWMMPYFASVCAEEPISLRASWGMVRGNVSRLLACQFVVLAALGLPIVGVGLVLGGLEMVETVALAWMKGGMGAYYFLEILSDAIEDAPLFVLSMIPTTLDVLIAVIMVSMDGRVFAYLRDRSDERIVDVFS